MRDKFEVRRADDGSKGSGPRTRLGPRSHLALGTGQVGTPSVEVAYLLDGAAVERPELISGVAERNESVDVDAVWNPEQGLNLGMVAQVEGREASAKAGSPRR